MNQFANTPPGSQVLDLRNGKRVTVISCTATGGILGAYGSTIKFVPEGQYSLVEDVPLNAATQEFQDRWQSHVKSFEREEARHG